MCYDNHNDNHNANIVIMGKTGAGKSTIVNAVMAKEVAITGIGQSITTENQVYSRTMMLPYISHDNFFPQVKSTINLYDTVGLEINSSKTQKTLAEIQGYIDNAKNKNTDIDINLVWFCVNNRSSRFELYEIELIKELANSHEIPFIIALTQCFSNEKGTLEKQIERELPEVSTMRVLAKDYKTRAGVFSAFGIEELLHHSIFNYDRLKVNILESKLESLLCSREDRIMQIKEKAQICIEEHRKSAQNIGWVPAFCIPIVHGICIKMLAELDKIVGIHTAKGFGEEIFLNVIVGILATPFMTIPFISAGVAQAYVEQVGEDYLKALLAVIEKSSDSQLANMELMSKRIKEELVKRS